ncbi:MAG: DNA-protecting protein DprA [Fibrobacteraceae bacterium]|nr:DNA-protecting protein DprA [Fibrobacteraceae bacterium]
MFTKDRKYSSILPSNFPLLLSQSKHKPNELYYAGTLPSPQKIGVAMVGTRRCSDSAKELCHRLVSSLQSSNAVVVSGLAQGIDSLCHEAALNCGIPTIAVLPHSIDCRMSKSQEALAQRIIDQGGALVSEYEKGITSQYWTFVNRNRIISGLSQVTVLVECPQKSGALHTADYCLKDNRLLLAIPGNFNNPYHSGCNQYLDKGIAKPVYVPEHLRETAGIPMEDGLKLEQVIHSGCTLSPKALQIFTEFKGFQKTMEEIQAQYPMNMPELLAILTELEISGLVYSTDNFQFHFNGVL